MRRSLSLVLVLFAVSLALGQPAPAAVPPAGCAPTIEAVFPGAEIAATTDVAEFPSALVLTSEVSGGVRHRLVRAGGLWCDAQSAFNSAWGLAGLRGGAGEQAAAYASLAAAPWFDGVIVRSVSQHGPGSFTVETHARTNGVVAVWEIRSDAGGIRSATWKATGFAVPPFDAYRQGLTAIPGATRTFTRRAGGLLRPDAPLLPPPTVETLAAEATANDGFVLRIRNGDTPMGIALDQDTGVDLVDIVRLVRQSSVDNYNEFLSWGLHKGWRQEFGTVYIDDATALTCLACVFISETFNIHLNSQVLPLFKVLGFSYPDDHAALSDIIGHEMFHNFQMVYLRPQSGGSSMSTAFIEGTARFQETLHAYSPVSHTPGSLVYNTSSPIAAGNTCNWYLRDGPTQADAVAKSPSAHLYDACLFWLTWYASHGVTGLVGLLEASFAESPKAAWAEMRGMIETATGASVTGDLARFAERILTRRGMVWGPASGSGTVLDWGTLLDPWTPPSLSAGQSTSIRIGDGGILGAQVAETGIASLTGPSAIVLHEIRDDGTSSTITAIPSGTTVAGPGAGERVWLVAVNPASTRPVVTMSLDAAP